uniref:Uncharacterized protein n=1 Tax=Otolemur garnettii TaxID=30611 RepID=H0XV71_OTOGA
LDGHFTGLGFGHSGDSLVTDRELQDAFSRLLLKSALSVVLEGLKKAVNEMVRPQQCLTEFKRDPEWAEKLDVTLSPVPGISRCGMLTLQNKDQRIVNTEEDFQREMSFLRCCQHQTSGLAILPHFYQLKIPTKQPTDFFCRLVRNELIAQMIQQKLHNKQAAMEKLEKAKPLKYGKKVSRKMCREQEKEKAHMMNAIKKYQKGFSDKLDFLEGDQKPISWDKKAGAKGQQVKK